LASSPRSPPSSSAIPQCFPSSPTDPPQPVPTPDQHTSHHIPSCKHRDGVRAGGQQTQEGEEQRQRQEQGQAQEIHTASSPAVASSGSQWPLLSFSFFNWSCLRFPVRAAATSGPSSAPSSRPASPKLSHASVIASRLEESAHTPIALALLHWNALERANVLVPTAGRGGGCDGYHSRRSEQRRPFVWIPGVGGLTQYLNRYQDHGFFNAGALRLRTSTDF
jgi:hypothetical protein